MAGQGGGISEKAIPPNEPMPVTSTTPNVARKGGKVAGKGVPERPQSAKARQMQSFSEVKSREDPSAAYWETAILIRKMKVSSSGSGKTQV